MKKIKILLVLLTISAAGFYSCTDNDSVQNEVVTSKSMALRTMLNQLSQTNGSGRFSNATQSQPSCFEFVYPLTLSYNDGTIITVNTQQGLIDVIIGETQTSYITGIAFPFQIQQNGAVNTIDDEAEFYALTQSCGYNDAILDFSCLQINFPISVIDDTGATVAITSQSQFESSLIAGTISEIIFPINVVQNNQTIQVTNLFQLFDLYDDCNSNVSCNCPTDVNPVCVQTASGIVTYDNACLAQCDGFTTADFVNCNPVNTPGFGTNLGSCFTLNYPIQIQFQGVIITANNDAEVLQYYFPSQSNIPAFVYPLTLDYNTPAGPVTITIDSQAGFEAATSAICN
jgi:hypothetical protein